MNAPDDLPPRGVAIGVEPVELEALVLQDGGQAAAKLGVPPTTIRYSP